MKSLETAGLWKGYFAVLVFWHRFHKVGFGWFPSDVILQQLTHFMEMLEAEQKIVSMTLFDLFVPFHSPFICDAMA